jgi:hypothetical protein
VPLPAEPLLQGRATHLQVSSYRTQRKITVKRSAAHSKLITAVDANERMAACNACSLINELQLSLRKQMLVSQRHQYWLR